MGCYLRAFGRNFDVDAFASDTGIQLVDRFRRGEPRNRASKVLNETSGVVIEISDAKFADFEQQMRDAIEFLRSSRYEVSRVAEYAGVEDVYIDFGVRWPRDPVESWSFEPEIIELLSGLGVGLVLTQYPVS